MDQPKPAAGAARQKTDNEKYCSTCGKLIHRDAEICPKCGVRQHAAPAAAAAAVQSGQVVKSKVAAGLFALLLGGLGIHKFYLGKVGQGIVYFIFSWTFVPSLIAFIEGIIYLSFSGTDEAFTRRYSD